MIKIVADDKIPFIEEGLSRLKGLAEYLLLPGSKISSKDLLDADALITRTRTKCDAKLLDGTKIRFIASATIGHDHIDSGYCASRRIYWTNAPGCNSSSVAQYFASAILNVAEEKGLKLDRMTLGVLGIGNVGSKIARLAKIMGMRVLLNDPPRQRAEGGVAFSDLSDILKESDMISFHVPLDRSGLDKTFHMADEAFFRKAKKGLIFMNSSRGEVSDTEALKSAIKESRISCAVIDVWENEPEIDLELLGLARFASPHIAGYSTDGKANGTSACVCALERFFEIGDGAWKPHSIPLPANRIIEIDPQGKDFQRILSEAVEKTYSVRRDDKALRENPGNFEKLRGEYPLRREFPAYCVRLLSENASVEQNLRDFGFLTA